MLIASWPPLVATSLISKTIFILLYLSNLMFSPNLLPLLNPLLLLIPIHPLLMLMENGILSYTSQKAFFFLHQFLAFLELILDFLLAHGQYTWIIQRIVNLMSININLNAKLQLYQFLFFNDGNWIPPLYLPS
jgi:hypothetical protein